MKTRLMFRNACILLLMLALTAGTAEAAGGHPYNRNYYPAKGQGYYSMPRASVQLNFGGNPFYYAGGSFYRPVSNYYRVSYPPYGIRVNSLPPVYQPVSLGGNPYYYADGSFYRQRERDYEVVEAPLGASVPSLPRDAKTIVINGEKFYELNGTYYKDDIRNNGELWFRVMGKNGVVNTDRNNTANNNSNNGQDNNRDYDNRDYNNRDYNRNNTRSSIPPANNRTDVYRNRTPNANNHRNEVNRTPANNVINRSSDPDEQEEIEKNKVATNPVTAKNTVAEAEVNNAGNMVAAPTINKESASVVPAAAPVPMNSGVRTKITSEDLKKAAPATVISSNNNRAAAPVIIEEESDDQPLVIDQDDLPDNNPTERINGKPVMGRVFNSLPNNYKVAMINGRKYYVTPDNVFYQEFRDRGVMKYKVVGR